MTRRALILFVFGVIFAGTLLAFDLILSSRAKPVVSEPQPVKATASTAPAQNPLFSLPPAPPAAPQAEQRPQKTAPAARVSLEPKAKPADLKELFASGVPAEEVALVPQNAAPLLREYVAKNHPSLKLSDREFERLAEIISVFRDANLKMNSLERTAANAPAIRKSLQEMATAMQDFRQITGMNQDEFFVGEDAPVRFGGEEDLFGDEEIVPEFLPAPHS